MLFPPETVPVLGSLFKICSYSDLCHSPLLGAMNRGTNIGGGSMDNDLSRVAGYTASTLLPTCMHRSRFPSVVVNYSTRMFIVKAEELTADV